MTLEKAILATLRYSDHFGFPLASNEIYSRLISFPLKSKQILLTALNKLIKQKIIGQTKGLFYLAGRSHLVLQRTARETQSRPLLHHARELASHLASFPGIRAIYLTGSLAVQNSGKEGDIDFMIITNPGVLWTTRFILTLYSTIFGLRRTPFSLHNSGKLCLNLYLSPDSYLIPENRRNLYTAYELIQAVPLYDPQDTQSSLLSANSWLSTYLPNFPLPNTNLIHRFTNIPIYNKLFESLLYRLQYLYMKNKITREYITKDSAFFHPQNPGVSVLKKLSL